MAETGSGFIPRQFEITRGAGARVSRSHSPASTTVVLTGEERRLNCEHLASLDSWCVPPRALTTSPASICSPGKSTPRLGLEIETATLKPVSPTVISAESTHGAETERTRRVRASFGPATGACQLWKKTAATAAVVAVLSRATAWQD